MLKTGSLVSTEENRRVGILGGTFDPVHYAHLALAEEVCVALKLVQMIFVPTGQPPHKMGQHITPSVHRQAMLELAIASNPRFSLSLIDIQRAGPSYTVDTLRLLRQELGGQTELFFVIGGDSLEDLPRWHDPAGIIQQAMLVALVRPGYMEVEQYGARLEQRLPGINQRLITLTGPRMDISSTDLRQRMAEGRPIKYQVPEAVENYIYHQELYRTVAGERQIQAGQGDIHATNTF